MCHNAADGSTGLGNMTHSACTLFLGHFCGALRGSFVPPRHKKSSRKLHQGDWVKYRVHVAAQHTKAFIRKRRCKQQAKE
jgi:hypothetical protein